ncbi:M23 family metallopeptidase [Sporolactobacillus shoreae]|uniref:M23 family metallopeptidase n=1 Tax=Sporolactobacillus shoreae TaxID=1465501 RepID=A0A4Z0GS93_9BACL|nr:M23 family metallopeptidase [Sporolactobacillus shoreae]TGA99776.1 M23 family metallopeptidase [Sporolactobacillus shoreae]
MTENKDQKKLQEKELSGLRKLAKRRWFYPALYLCVASLILTGVLLFQLRGADQAKNQEEQNRVVFNQNKPSSPLTAGEEVFQWPAAKADTQVVQPFYDAKGTTEEQQAALVNYNNTFVQNTGINIGAKDDQSFTVTAALSGTVTEAKKDNLLGYTVTLKHANGVESLYQSLASIDVKMGQEVKQGDTIGTAGTEAFNKPMGIHAHFEIRKNGIPVDPVVYMDKAASDIKTVTVGAQSTTAPVASEKTKTNQGGSSTQTPAPAPGKTDQSKSNTGGSSTGQGSQNSGN